MSRYLDTLSQASGLTGEALSSATLYFYEASPTSTWLATYQDEALTIANTNPVVADGEGRFPDIWLQAQKYYVEFYDGDGNLKDTQDNVTGLVISSTILANIAALTALVKATLLDDVAYDVAGYTTVGDNAGGQFYWDSSSALTANGGTIIASDEGGNGRWLRIENHTLTAREFGAPNDGVSLYTTQIQAMFDDVAVATGGNWYDKGGASLVEAGKRIAVGSYQSSVTGIIEFNALDWPLNTTVQFYAGARELVWHMNNIADNGTPVNEFRLEAPYHPALIFNYRSPASYSPFTQEAHGAAASQGLCSILFSKDTVDQFQFFCDTTTEQLQVKTFPPIAGGFLSKVWHIEAETGDMGIQASSTDTSDNSALQVGGAMKVRSGAVAINGHESDVEPRIYLHDGTSGQRSYIGMDATSKAFKMVPISAIAEGANFLELQSFAVFEQAAAAGTTDGALRIGKNTANSRSINATGTVNASGADYAEYVKKSLSCGTRLKGDICGVTKDGELTDKFSESIQFIIKSTNPSYVGGDTWWTESPDKQSSEWYVWKEELKAIYEEAPDVEARNIDDWEKETAFHNSVKPKKSNEHYDIWVKQSATLKKEKPTAGDENRVTWEARCQECIDRQPLEPSDEWKAWKAASEETRKQYDRVGFSGLVPVNCTGNAGDYLLPKEVVDDGIGYLVKADVTFEEHKIAVGRIWSSGDEVIAKVMQ